jgi:predicted ribosomally synthesized peptide with nif11-like leader
MFHPSLKEKAAAATSPEELLALAKSEGIDLTEAEATAYFNQLNAAEGELADEELDNVAGGDSCGGDKPKYKLVPSGDRQPCFEGTNPNQRCGYCDYALNTSSEKYTAWVYCKKQPTYY